MRHPRPDENRTRVDTQRATGLSPSSSKFNKTATVEKRTGNNQNCIFETNSNNLCFVYIFQSDKIVSYKFYHVQHSGRPRTGNPRRFA
jgi:hypothetical protein